MRLVRLAALLVALTVACGVCVFFLSVPAARHAYGRDLDGKRQAVDPLKHAWFDKLASGKGLCCSFADGVSIADVDWDMGGTVDEINSGYRVHVGGGWPDWAPKGEWIEVPKAALITEPNLYGQAVVWPYQDYESGTGKPIVAIRCFLRGADI